MEVYNDFNSDLSNLFRCVRDRPLALLKELNFLPLNGRDEFSVLKKYLEKEEFTNEYLREELVLAERYLTPLQLEEIRPILMEKAQMNDVKRAAVFYRLIRLSYEALHQLWMPAIRYQENLSSSLAGQPEAQGHGH
jgi:DNA adenine methylase